jgi:predicted amidohydrolase YtcJ
MFAVFFRKGAKMYASHVFLNAQVITVDDNDSLAQAVAVCDSKIVFVGSQEGLRPYIGPETNIIDASGCTVMPGFIDAHVHAEIIGIGLNSPSLLGARSIADIQAIIAEEAKKVPRGGIIRAYLYDHMALAEGRPPTRWELDEAAPEHRVFIVHKSFHISVANSLGLEFAGVDRNTPNPDGGEFVRNEEGELTGLALEHANGYLYEKFSFDAGEMEDVLLAADAFFAHRGITSIHSPMDNVRAMAVLTDMKSRGKMNTRIYAMPFPMEDYRFMDKFLGIGMHTGFGSDSYKLGAFKLMIDGSSMGGTAYMKEPYCDDPERKGFLTMDQETLDKYFLAAHLEGWQITSHAIGDRAIEMVLDAIEKAFAAKPVEDARPRIEHCLFADKEIIRRCKELGVIPVPQTEFILSAGDAYIKIYGDRVNHAFPCKSFLDAGIKVAFSSDGPVSPPAPLMQMYAACTRLSSTGQPLGLDEAITLPQAIRMATSNGAYASCEEHIKGSLEPGKLADIIMLSRPILDGTLEDLKDTRVTLTMVGGKITHTE